MFQSAFEYFAVFFPWLGSLFFNTAFIGTFLFFTLVIWIGMSGEDREPVSSFSKAGLIAFICAVFIFAVIMD
jgi:hypothetical protein